MPFRPGERMRGRDWFRVRYRATDFCSWLVLAQPFIDDLPQQVIVSPSQVFDLDDSFGRTYWVWLKTSGAPKRLVGGGGAPSGIVDMTRGRRWRQSLSSSAWSMPVPVRPA
jgi:hypothetical protein